ncbi:pre-mRNA-splicing factor, partial [Acrasis kona]
MSELEQGTQDAKQDVKEDKLTNDKTKSQDANIDRYSRSSRGDRYDDRRSRYSDRRHDSYRRDDRYDDRGSRKRSRPHDDDDYDDQDDYDEYDARERERRRQRQEHQPRVTKKATIAPEQLTPAQQLEKYKSTGIYMPPHKLKQLKQTVTDQKSDDYQRLYWDTLKKSINGIVNKVNAANIKNIIPELFNENLIRGRGLFVRSIMKAQAASPEQFTRVYAALICVVNSSMPEIGQLALIRLIVSFRRAYRRNDKAKCISTCMFMAHLVNQQVASEVLAGEILGLLLSTPTDDSVEMSVSLIKACGASLLNNAPKILHAVFERLRSVLHEGTIDKRIQYMIEALFAIRKTEFNQHPSITQELDLIEEQDRITHELELDDDTLDAQDRLDYYHFDEEFEQNEKTYHVVKNKILGNDDDDDQQEEEEEEEEDDDQGASSLANDASSSQIQASTEAQSAEMKKTIYLTIMSSMSHEETVHKLIKNGLVQQGKEMELCSMIIECCAQERTYIRYYGLVSAQLCKLQRSFQDTFAECFKLQYDTIHRLETNRSRNVAKLFGHLFVVDAITWSVFETVHINGQETSSSSRIFIKILFQEMCEQLGQDKLVQKLMHDDYMKPYYKNMFPCDNAKNTAYAINFWTSIELGRLTDEMRSVLKSIPKVQSY